MSPNLNRIRRAFARLGPDRAPKVISTVLPGARNIEIISCGAISETRGLNIVSHLVSLSLARPLDTIWDAIEGNVKRFLRGGGCSDFQRVRGLTEGTFTYEAVYDGETRGVISVGLFASGKGRFFAQFRLTEPVRR